MIRKGYNHKKNGVKEVITDFLSISMQSPFSPQNSNPRTNLPRSSFRLLKSDVCIILSSAGLPEFVSPVFLKGCKRLRKDAIFIYFRLFILGEVEQCQT